MCILIEVFHWEQESNTKLFLELATTSAKEYTRCKTEYKRKHIISYFHSSTSAYKKKHSVVEFHSNISAHTEKKGLNEPKILFKGVRCRIS